MHGFPRISDVRHLAVPPFFNHFEYYLWHMFLALRLCASVRGCLLACGDVAPAVIDRRGVNCVQGEELTPNEITVAAHRPDRPAIRHDGPALTFRRHDATCRTVIRRRQGGAVRCGGPSYRCAESSGRRRASRRRRSADAAGQAAADRTQRAFDAQAMSLDHRSPVRRPTNGLCKHTREREDATEKEIVETTD